MSNMVFQAATLRAGKRGVIAPDAAGYYTQCIGGLDIENSMGVTYAAERAKNLFMEGADLQRRIKERALRGEAGHPRRTPGMSDDQWIHRLHDIVEDKICVYWAEIGLDENYGRNNPHLNRPAMVGIMARYRPGGIGAQMLERDLADPEANVSFSIRAFSSPFSRMGKRFYDLQTIVTWDYVNEPGIAPAAKTLSSTLESLHEDTFTSRQLQHAIDAAVPSNTAGDLVVSNESRNRLMELANVIQIDTGVSKPTSVFYSWATKK